MSESSNDLPDPAEQYRVENEVQTEPADAVSGPEVPGGPEPEMDYPPRPVEEGTNDGPGQDAPLPNPAEPSE